MNAKGEKASSEGLEPSISRFVVSRLIQLGHEDIAYKKRLHLGSNQGPIG